MRNYTTPSGAVLTEIEARHIITTWVRGSLNVMREIPSYSLADIQEGYERMCEKNAG